MIKGICFTTCEDKNIESSSKISQQLCHNHNQESIKGLFILSLVTALQKAKTLKLCREF